MKNIIKSIWEDVAVPSFDTLDGDRQTDVLIIGGGIAGILIAHELRRANVNCIIAEANTVCSGVTKNTTAKITSQHGYIYSRLLSEMGADKARMYYNANQGAVQKYRKLCRDFDCDFEETSAYLYALSTPKEMENELDALAKLKIPHRYSETSLPVYTLGAICFDNQAQFHPLKFLRHILGDLTVYEHTKVEKIENGIAYTNRGKIRAKKFVVTTHFPFINRHGMYFLKMYQERAYVIGIKADKQTDGMYKDGKKGGLSLRRAGEYLLIGCGAHRTGKESHGWRDAENFAKKYFPHCPIEFRFATQDCITPDGIPYIGQYSKSTPNLYVATGFNKWGMTSSMVAADLIRDLILEKDNEYTSLFSPSRSILKPQVALNALESAVNLLRPTAPRCPHLGCALKWNDQERSWDCPCHGSRFDSDGRLLNNPATKGLHNKKS